PPTRGAWARLPRANGYWPTALRSLGHVGQQRDHTGTLDGRGQLTLMLGAGAGHAAGQDLAALAGVLHAQAHHVLVVDVLNFIHAELANLAAGLAAAGAAYPFASIFRHCCFPP